MNKNVNNRTQVHNNWKAFELRWRWDRILWFPSLSPSLCVHMDWEWTLSLFSGETWLLVWSKKFIFIECPLLFLMKMIMKKMEIMEFFVEPQVITKKCKPNFYLLMIASDCLHCVEHYFPQIWNVFSVFCHNAYRVLSIFKCIICVSPPCTKGKFFKSY